ncbi:hypothetical protein BC828DRAFT_392853, partial [Blastocladiella britannica]
MFGLFMPALDPYPNHLAMCLWWRDRAIQDGLVLEIAFVDRLALFDSIWAHEDDAEPDPVQEFEINDLVHLGEHGLLETMQLWAAMVDAGLLPPLPVEPNQHGPLSRCKILDVAVLEWWLQRHLSHGLPFLSILELLANATNAGRLDTLDWIWKTCIAFDAETVQFIVPPRANVTRETREQAMTWWATLNAKHGVESPLFVWAHSDLDTRDDLQAFWDSARKLSEQVYFSEQFVKPSADTLAWLVEHADCPRVHGIRIDISRTLGRMWKEYDFNGLETLVSYAERGAVMEIFNTAAGNCLIQAADQGDMVFLKVWYDCLAFRLGFDARLTIQVLLLALRGGHVQFASLWNQCVLDFQYELVLPELVERLCEVWHSKDIQNMTAGVCWIVQEFGAAELSTATMEKLLKRSDQVECMQFLEWLVVEGLDRGVTVAELKDEALGAQWEQVYRVVRLTLL